MIPMLNSTPLLRGARKRGLALSLAILPVVTPLAAGSALAQGKGAAPVLNVGASEHAISRRLDAPDSWA